MRPIARAVLLSVLIIVIAFVAFSYLSGTAYWRYPRANPSPDAVGTIGTINTEKARQAGAEVGEKEGIAAAKVGQAVDEAALTSKIKAKMVLDDSIKARAIDVTTNGSVVTLTGTVGSQAEHDRAVALAGETAGVTKVVDRLVIQR
jgi:hyperosmotically inducible protein